MLPLAILLLSYSLNLIDRCPNIVDTKMDNQQVIHMNTRVPVTDSMVHALDQFIMPKLTDHGWLSFQEDNENLRDEIIKKFLRLCCAGNSQRVILESLADNWTHAAMARWISAIFLGGNPAPRDRSLLSFTDGVVSFFYDLCHDHFARGLTADFGSQVVAHDGPSSYAQVNLQTVGPTSRPATIRPLSICFV